MNAFTISFLLIVISTWSMACILFLKSEGRKSPIMWGWLCISISIWGVGGLIATTTLSEEISFIGWKIANIGSIIIPVVFFQFVNAYFELNKRCFIIFLYTVAGFFLFINFFSQHLFFGHLKFIFNEFYYLDWSIGRGPVYLMLYVGFYWILLLYSLFFLFKNLILSHGIRKNEIKYLIVCSSIGWVGAHGDFLSVFRHDIYPYSNFLIAIFPLITGYAIIRHKILNIQVVIKRSLVYSILITLLTLIYVFLVLLIEQLFRGTMGYGSSLISIGTALVIALIATPLKNKIQDMIDKLFLKGTPFEIANENFLLRKEVAESEKSKAVATLASGIAHEIKNPLTAIKTFVDYLPEKKDDTEFLHRFNKVVGGEITRVDQLVHQLLEFAKPSPLQLQTVDINKLLEDSLDLISNEIHKKSIKVMKDLKPLPKIQADSNKLKQAFLNIMMNATEAMPNGGELTIKTQLLNSRTIEISIQDAGPGIDPKDIPHIFDPFYSRKEKGTGLGLAITKGIIEEHNGTIKVESNVGAGTKFKLQLKA